MPVLLWVWLLAFNQIEGAAYELRTHERLTASAFDTSPALRTYLDEVGISARDIFDFRNRTPEDQLARFTNNGTPQGWMIEGAIREDDYQLNPSPILEFFQCDPPRNPLSWIDRPLHHFLDVQRGGRGLTAGPFSGIPATDWALGQRGRGPSQTDNQFSILDARTYQLRSLTEPERAERDRNTARLFRTLGQVVHLLQDMAQPQHTRNDPHAGCLELFGGEHSWYEHYLEARALGQQFRQRGQPFPLPLAGYAPPRFTSYRDFFTQATQAGLADFSSRNFFSAGTNLSLLGSCGGLPEPPCRRDAYAQRDTPFSFTAVDGTTVAGTVALFLRTMQDPVTGNVIPDVAVSSRSLWDQHLERRGFFPRFTLNTLNYDSISDVLIPRAVGYSAGFLDYFFRGRLDVDLIEDPTDPSVVRLQGTNTSSDSLDGGTLMLYGDSLTTGHRQPLEALDPDLTVTAPAGASVRSARFQVPPDAERFVAVYQGKLGTEAPGTDFPGAVVAKALGGVRVEQVFYDFDAGMWKLRTPKGVFVLKLPGRDGPLTQADFEEMKWGDGDRLVGRSPIGRGLPNRVVAWGVQRNQQSPVGLVTEDSPDGKVVRLIEQARAPLPSALNLGTTISVANTINYRQEMVATDFTNNLVWNPATFLYEDNITVDSRVETMADESLVFSAIVPIVLDLDHYIGLSEAPATNPSYVWFLQDAALNAAGHLVGVVGVLLASPRDNLVQRLAFCREGPGQGALTSKLGNVGQPFPNLGEVVVWAVVDLTAGQVLASTAGPTISMASRSTVHTEWTPFNSGPPPVHSHHLKYTYSGGPVNGRVEEATTCRSMTGPLLESADLSDFTIRAEHSVMVQDEHAVDVRGSVRGDLQAALGGLNRNSSSVLPVTYKWFDAEVVVHAAGVIRSSIVKDPTVSNPVRARDGSDRLLLVANGRANDQGTDMVLAWDPGATRAQVPLVVAGLSPEVGGELSVTATTGSIALVSAFARGGSYLLSLDGAFGPRFFADPEGRLSGFTLLDSQRLYDSRTLRFFKLQPPLQPTALPARLAPAASNPFGDFHVIRLP